MTMFRAIPISGGWKMAVNNYFDFNGKTIVDWNDPRRSDLNATMLGLKSTLGFVVDLGWSPEADINGNYRLELLSDDWEKTYFNYSTKDLVDLEKVLFPLLSLQANELEQIVYSGSIESELFNKKDILIPTYLFSGWQMDVNVVCATKILNEKSLVFKCSEPKRRLSVEIAIVDLKQLVIRLKYNDLCLNELLIQDHAAIRDEINDFMIYYHTNLLSDDFKSILINYKQ